jgi:hypothetical protein
MLLSFCTELSNVHVLRAEGSCSHYIKHTLVHTFRTLFCILFRYDKNHPSAMSLEAFEGAKMTAPVFKEQLKRVFHIKLTAAELAALMRHFDQYGDGESLTEKPLF